ncbi:unnamed protein product [Protopolystoma xenopodis]|uniref:Uncharacterized protein n=1 Tax=Protopolystoma xenopodis TaxID=117903 RepID=A0A448XCT4_9PLAT|nr:unnamed protein product [Protopolystoma xenopodis]
MPASVYDLLQELFLKNLETRTFSPHREEHLGSDSHACRYRALSPRLKPVFSERIEVVWSFEWISSRISVTVMINRLSGPVTAGPPKLWLFLQTDYTY